MATPHNEAQMGQIAKTVLMPGDPLRAKFIAENFLENPKLVNKVRNMFAYTGTYKGHEITIMAHGMGIPSVGIYSYELFTQYDVENIVRIGSAGSYTEKAKVFDVVVVDGAYSESSYAKTMNGYDKDMTYPSEELTSIIKATAKELEQPIVEGNCHSGDCFYRITDDSKPTYWEKLRDERNCVAVEMESFALFHNANVTGKRAACILTISDSFVSPEITTSEEREKCFTNMMKLALESAIKF